MSIAPSRYCPACRSWVFQLNFVAGHAWCSKCKGKRFAPTPVCVSGELEQAYSTTDFVVLAAPIVHIEIGKSCREIPSLLGKREPGYPVLVSACNPFSKQLPPHENAHRHDALLRLLSELGHESLPAEGRDPTGRWAAERSVLVLAGSAELADQLMVQFMQNAVVVFDPQYRAALRWHPGAVVK